MPNDFNGFRVSPRVSSISFRSSPALADGVQGSRQAVAPAVDLLAAVDPAAGVAVADVEAKLKPLEGRQEHWHQNKSGSGQAIWITVQIFSEPICLERAAVYLLDYKARATEPSGPL